MGSMLAFQTLQVLPQGNGLWMMIENNEDNPARQSMIVANMAPSRVQAAILSMVKHHQRHVSVKLPPAC